MGRKKKMKEKLPPPPDDPAPPPPAPLATAQAMSTSQKVGLRMSGLAARFGSSHSNGKLPSPSSPTDNGVPPGSPGSPTTPNGNEPNGHGDSTSPISSSPNSPVPAPRSSIPVSISVSKPPLPRDAIASSPPPREPPLSPALSQREDLPPQPGTPQTPRLFSLRHIGGSNTSISSSNRPVDLVTEDRPGSSQSMATALSPADSSISAASHRTKMTVGEIVQQIELRIRTLLKHDDFTTPETLADLQFLTQQARYSGDVHVKRKLVIKMVEFGILDLFVKVMRSCQSVDYLRYLGITEDADETHHNSSADLTREEDDAKDDISLSETYSVSDAGERKLAKAASDQSRLVHDCIKNLRCAVTIISNISEKSFTCCEACIQKGLIKLLLRDMMDPRLGVPELQDPSKMYLVKGYLGILGNIIRFIGDARDFYREAGAVKVLQQYLKSNLLIIKTRTIMLLSYIINESENDIINASDKNLSLMVKVLGSCIESDNHFSRKYGYWAVEILAGINRLATSESNKERLVHRGALKVYTRLLHPTCSEEEQLLSTQGIWVMAFNQDNKKRIRDEPGCVEALEYLVRQSAREEIKRTAKGALWVIQGPGSSLKQIGSSSSTSSEEAGSMGHVMLSYQWASKSPVLRLRDKLKSTGYKVWMDINNTGTTLENMSDAVNKALVVIICMSQKYKDSPSCRTEAEFAYKSRKELMAVRIQPRYNPDGWLAAMVGTRLSFDCSSAENLDAMVVNLVRELGTRGRVKPLDQASLSSFSGSHTALATSQTSIIMAIPDNYNRLLHWSPEEVSKWLADNHLHIARERLKHVNGELLLEIKKMQRQAPETFYSMLKSELALDFVNILRFTKALDKL